MHFAEKIKCFKSLFLKLRRCLKVSAQNTTRGIVFADLRSPQPIRGYPFHSRVQRSPARGKYLARERGVCGSCSGIRARQPHHSQTLIFIVQSFSEVFRIMRTLHIKGTISLSCSPSSASCSWSVKFRPIRNDFLPPLLKSTPSYPRLNLNHSKTVSLYETVL